VEFQKPEYSMSFDDSPGEVIKGNDQSLNDLTQKILKSTNPAPVIEDVPDTYVKLPAGLVSGDEVIQNAEVRELTGKHEELLAKAKLSNNAAKYIDTLLQCGVVSVGEAPATSALLDTMLQGDLDALIMGIRRATFGATFEVFNVACPTCEAMNDLEMDLTDIPVKELDDPLVREFIVDLRKGRKARVQFPTGALQKELFKKQIDITEMNSVTLATCVLSFIDAKGNERPCNGLLDVRDLGVSDRRTLQEYIYTNQPGPRYDQVTAQCHSCEGEVPVPLTVGILFREL
jgi:hypothetical protein